MAANLNSALNFRFNKTLFRDLDNFKPIVFYSDNPNEDLKNIISKGGGYITDCADEADIILCEKKTDVKVNEGYLPLDFIVDCVMKNKFLSVDTYREDVLGLRASTSKDSAKNIDSNDDDSFRPYESSRMRLSKENMTGRKKYSLQEDLDIIKYLINHKGYSKTGGNMIWKKMESLKVTQHTYQSMKARFKLIISQIESYNIPDEWKEKLTWFPGEKADSSTSSDEDTGIGTSFNAIDKWKTKQQESATSTVFNQIEGIINADTEGHHDVNHNKNQSDVHNDKDTSLYNQERNNNITSSKSVSPNLSISPISSISPVSSFRIRNGHRLESGNLSFTNSSTPCKFLCQHSLGTKSALNDDLQSHSIGLSQSSSELTEELSSAPRASLHQTIVENSCSSDEKVHHTFLNQNKSPLVRLERLPMTMCIDDQNSSSISDSSSEISFINESLNPEFSSAQSRGNHVADEATLSDNLDCLTKNLKLTPLDALYLLKKFQGNLMDSVQYLHSKD